MAAVLKNILPAKTVRRSPTAPSAVLVEKQYYDDAVALGNAKFIQLMLPWVALENFRAGRARDSDWMMLQYWLYYAEAIITLYTYEHPEDRSELGLRISDALQALFAGGRRYNQSKYTVMTLTPDECDLIRDGLLIGDEFKSITDEKALLAVGKHVQRVLNVPPTK